MLHDWQRASNLTEETDWQSLITCEVDTSWNDWQNRFLEIMSECIPHRGLPSHHNLPQLSKSLVQLMRRRNMFFIRSKRSKKKSDFEKYKKLHNRVVAQLRSAKSSLFCQIYLRDTAKKFWEVCKISKQEPQFHSCLLTGQHLMLMLMVRRQTCLEIIFPVVSTRWS